MYNSGFQHMIGPETNTATNSKLQAVFEKLTGVFPRAGDLGSGASAHKTVMSSDIIESVLTDTPLPPRECMFRIFVMFHHFPPSRRVNRSEQVDRTANPLPVVELHQPTLPADTRTTKADEIQPLNTPAQSATPC
ncbi:hypothetical protein CBL_09388 [Carabus blaptoides fortunei]